MTILKIQCRGSGKYIAPDSTHHAKCPYCQTIQFVGMNGKMRRHMAITKPKKIKIEA